MPEPLVLIPPGVRVNVQVPVAGKLLIATLPVEKVHVGWEIVPITGADGASGTALITIFDEEVEVHPDALVTVYVYVPGASPAMVVLVPVPVAVAPPGFLIKVQVPGAVRLFNTTLPVGTAQVGCVIFPATGADGEAGTALMTTLDDEDEVHPDSLETV